MIEEEEEVVTEEKQRVTKRGRGIRAGKKLPKQSFVVERCDAISGRS